MLHTVLLGTGRMARTYCTHLAAMKDVQISAVVSRNGPTDLPLPGTENAHWVKTIEELKTFGQTLDLAFICLPSHLHRGAAELLSVFVPHIICEKPAALSYEDAVAMADTAQKHHCNLMVAQVLRFWDSYTALSKVLKLGEHELHSLTLRRRQPRPIWSAGHWLLDKTYSGGILYDLAIHDIDFVTCLFGQPQQVEGSQGPDGLSTTLFLRYHRFCVIIDASWTLPQSYHNCLTTSIEAVFTDKLVVFDSNIATDSYQCYDGNVQSTVAFPTWNAYARQLENLVGYVCNHHQNNPFCIETTLPALSVCQSILEHDSKG